MKYMGSKSRVVNEIAPIIQHYVGESENKIYVEPFVGGGNVIDHIVAPERYGYDINPYLIALFQHLDYIKDLPDSVDKSHYDEVRTCFNKKTVSYPFWYIGAIGFLASYNGRFFDGGYAGVVHTKAGTVRNYYSEARRNLESQIDHLRGVVFDCSDYRDIVGYEGCCIYCDPPYKGTKQYGLSRNFDHKSFWRWVRTTSRDNIVLVSEQEAPDDFECIWEQKVTRTQDNRKRLTAVERLFKLKN